MAEQKRILIVEDSPTVIEMIQMMLKNMNCKIFSAGSEFGMFQNVEQFGKTVDLILMDINLKNENGLDLVEKLRLNPKYMDLPVIVVTEHATKELILRAKELSVKSYIRKPFDKTVLVDRISDAIELTPLSEPSTHSAVQNTPTVLDAEVNESNAQVLTSEVDQSSFSDSDDTADNADLNND